MPCHLFISFHSYIPTHFIHQLFIELLKDLPEWHMRILSIWETTLDIYTVNAAQVHLCFDGSSINDLHSRLILDRLYFHQHFPPLPFMPLAGDCVGAGFLAGAGLFCVSLLSALVPFEGLPISFTAFLAIVTLYRFALTICLDYTS